LNNRPCAFYVTATGTTTLIDLQAVTGSRIYTGNTTGSASPSIGSPIVVLDSTYSGADGLYIVDSNNNPTLTNSTNAANTFTYLGKYYYTGTTGSIYNSGTTVAYNGAIFSNAAIGVTSASVVGNTVTVVTSVPHGMAIGNDIALTGASAANGSWTISTITSPTSFQYNTTGAYTPPAGAVTVTNASVYARPQGLALHRPFDGGVRFSSNASSHNQQYVRQTRRYFRYQSGKGIQMSTGTTLKPQFNLDGISSSGTLCTVITKDPHNITTLMGITVIGANESAYNGSFQINSVINPYSFTYIAATTPSATQASGPIYASANIWYGGSNRVGIFDSQNGMFWDYDGQTLSAVRRNSVYQIAGQVQVTPGSATVNANAAYPTYFNKQLVVNDFIVIKGMSYRVTNINSDQQLTIQPPYRGSVAATNATVSRTVDVRIPQSQFNIDRLDGTGPSGYNIDLTKMQMFYIDYSWYGSGFIRFGVRGSDGNIIYCHKIINNNQNLLAYMRSGNLPGRYETNTFSKTTFMLGGAGGVGTNFNSTDTVINVGSTAGWPSTGTLWVRTANNGGTSAANSEFITYTGISGNTFTGLIRGQAGAVTTGTTVSGNSYITSLATTTGIQTNQYIYGPGIPAQAYVQSIPNSTTVIMNYAAIGSGTGSTLTFVPLANTAQTFIYSATAQTAVELHGPTFSPEINHWGTSAIMDGGFTADKSFIFTKGMTSSISVPTGQTQALMSFRISPTASNGIPSSNLGAREVINRMQHLPFEADVYSNGSFLVTALLNATSNNTTEQWQNVGGSSLSQYIFHTAGTTVVPNTGEAVFGFYLNVNQGTYSTTQQDLTQLLAIGTSILGGGSGNEQGSIYPNGPDVLTFVVQNIDTASRNIQARYSWNEAQA
jgi:hypothetical protein